MEFTKVSFHESTYGDYIQLSESPPESYQAEERIQVSGTEYNNREYNIMFVTRNSEGKKLVVGPDSGLVGEIAENVTIKKGHYVFPE